jgi:hypothetical protein
MTKRPALPNFTDQHMQWIRRRSEAESAEYPAGWRARMFGRKTPPQKSAPTIERLRLESLPQPATGNRHIRSPPFRHSRTYRRSLLTALRPNAGSIPHAESRSKWPPSASIHEDQPPTGRNRFAAWWRQTPLELRLWPGFAAGLRVGRRPKPRGTSAALATIGPFDVDGASAWGSSKTFQHFPVCTRSVKSD